ncbi:MAG: hypothetical protein COW65_16775 [Cytophagales bacterium CG18_big_fil_WC_8_21_14_2_50_42_9]|nr:MAG: hypothetical protein COW65_16775 [Cytophagales bacterium CG18_big_fil_WC_8_21_14_2_50_42_9]
MKKLNVLLLGWEFPPIINGKVGTACYGITKALANQVNLSLVLPKSDPEFILRNVDLTGLNNVNLKEIQPPAPEPEFTAFGESPEGQQIEIPLYGAATPTLQEREKIKPPVLPGQTTSVGSFAGQSAGKPLYESVEELNIFGQTDLSLVDYNSQVINFARYASRLASYKEYDVIYAYDWMTFLAGIELKLVSGKPLVLQMHSLSYERGGPDAKGWVYELEKQALEKADFVITVNDNIADVIITEYGIAPAKIKSLKEEEEADDLDDLTRVSAYPQDLKAAEEQPDAEEISTEIYNMEISESNNDVVKTLLPLAEEDAEMPKRNWDETADIVLEILEKVNADAHKLAVAG